MEGGTLYGILFIVGLVGLIVWKRARNNRAGFEFFQRFYNAEIGYLHGVVSDETYYKLKALATRGVTPKAFRDGLADIIEQMATAGEDTTPIAVLIAKTEKDLKG